jgi:hypothetical protein
MSRERRAVFEFGLLLAQSLEQQQRDAQGSTSDSDHPSDSGDDSDTDATAEGEGSDSDFVKVDMPVAEHRAAPSMFGAMVGSAPPPPPSFGMMPPPPAPMAAPPPAPGGMAFGAAPRVREGDSCSEVDRAGSGAEHSTRTVTVSNPSKHQPTTLHRSHLRLCPLLLPCIVCTYLAHPYPPQKLYGHGSPLLRRRPNHTAPHPTQFVPPVILLPTHAYYIVYACATFCHPFAEDDGYGRPLLR